MGEKKKKTPTKEKRKTEMLYAQLNHLCLVAGAQN